MVHLPLTKHKVHKCEYGFYIHYSYVGNQVVWIPSFDDPQDGIKAAAILQTLYLYPTHKVVSIPMTEVFKDGGMVYSVTQQQPMARH